LGFGGKSEFVNEDESVRGYEGVIDVRRVAGRVFVSERNKHMSVTVLGRLAKKGGDASGFACPIISIHEKAKLTEFLREVDLEYSPHFSGICEKKIGKRRTKIAKCACV
jgi:hypothetical protein